MDVKEAAALLTVAPSTVKRAIKEGIALPKSGDLRQLEADNGPDNYEISDAQLQEYIDAFEGEEPGRHPPVAVRRELRVEAQHKCGVCRADLPLYFHHIVPWGKLKHHDPQHMLAVCGGCHSKIEVGQIDRVEQLRYKVKRQDEREAREHPSQILPGGRATPISWDDLASLISFSHEVVVEDAPSSSSQYDFSILELAPKNRLNELSADMYEVMRDEEPFFGRIQEFLGHPRNAATTMRYHEVIDELRHRVAANADRFEKFDDILLQLHADIVNHFPEKLLGKKRALRILISFMYFNCDIGRKA